MFLVFNRRFLTERKNMKKSLFVIGAVLLSALVASADEFGKYEAFLGYDWVKFNPSSSCSTTTSTCISRGFLPSFNANGGNGQFVYNFKKGFGVAFDFGAVTKGELNHQAIDATVFNFVVGPRYTFRFHEGRFRPFVQALFGGAYSAASTRLEILGGNVVTPHIFPPPTVVNPDLPFSTRFVTSRTGSAILLGGGLDIKMNKHVTFRPIGADYYMTRLPSLLTGNQHNASNFRYSVGVNFLFGEE
jgi:hypothetical protein